MILVDSNVLLDIFTNDPQWASWSADAVKNHGEKEILAINPIIYAEVSIAFRSREELDDIFTPEEFRRLGLPYEAGLLTGKSFLEYKKRGGSKRSSLPDFYIGAHAVVENLTLLSRDPKRYKTYFPSLKLITP